MSDLKHVPHSPPIDLSDWDGFSDDEELSKLLAKRCSEALRSVFMDDWQPYAYLPWEWSEGDGLSETERPDDPLTIYVRLPLGAADEHPTFSFSLNECIARVIELYEDSEGSGRIGEQLANVGAIRDALRAAAQRLEDAMHPGVDV